LTAGGRVSGGQSRTQRAGLTIVGLDAGQVLLPAQVLAVDLAQVGDEEGVFLADATEVVVDGVDAGLERVTNQTLCMDGAIAVEDIAGAVVEGLDVFQGELKVRGGSKDRRGHVEGGGQS
jgi:hypothetical protein